MTNQIQPPDLYYIAPNDTGGQITAEIVKIAGIVVGVAATPLLLQILTSRFPEYTRWFWAVGASAGFITILAGIFYAVRQNRRLKRLAEDSTPQKELFTRWVPPFRVIVSARRQQLLDQLEQAHASGEITEYVYETRLAQLKPANTAAQAATAWTLLPTIVISIGVFIVLPAFVAFLMQLRAQENPGLVDHYFSTPVFLLWITVEALYLYPLLKISQKRAAHVVGIAKSMVQIAAALVLWIFLGLTLGFTGLEWLFYVGAGLAVVGLVLGIVGAVMNRRLGGETAVSSPTASEIRQTNPDTSPAPLSAATDIVTPTDALPEPGAGYFHIRTRPNGTHHFQLNLSEDQMLLVGEDQSSVAACHAGIQATRQSALWHSRYHRESTGSNRHYFILTDDTGKVLGMSGMYPTPAARDMGLAMTQQLAFRAPLHIEEAGEPEIRPLPIHQEPPAPPQPPSSAAASEPPAAVPTVPVAAELPDTHPTPAPEPEPEPPDEPEIVLVNQAPAPKFQLYRGDDGQFYFRLLARNHENILASEGYRRKASCLKGIASVKRNGRLRERYKPQQASNGLYYFTLIAGNYEVIGMSELYDTQRSRNQGMDVVQQLAGWAPVEDLTQTAVAESGAPETNKDKRETAVTPPQPAPTSTTETLPPPAQDKKPPLPRFEIFQNETGAYYFRLRAANHEIVLASEAYVSLRGCENGIRSVRENAQLPARFKPETARDGQHYFTLVAGNHRVIGVSEQYTTARKRDNGIAVIQRIAPAATLTYLNETEAS